MNDMDDPIEHANTDGAARWSAPSTAKERNAVQNAVDRLFDALAPERATRRTERAPTALQRHRTPRGCILQATTGAVSVSWFADSANDVTMGELQIVAWRGVVSRPGSAQRTEGAVAMRELQLRPIEGSLGAWDWVGPDGHVYDTEALVNQCHALLDEQTKDAPSSATPTDGSRSI